MSPEAFDNRCVHYKSDLLINKLDKPEHWTQWLFLRKGSADQHQLWKYEDPDLSQEKDDRLIASSSLGVQRAVSQGPGSTEHDFRINAIPTIMATSSKQLITRVTVILESALESASAPASAKATSQPRTITRWDDGIKPAGAYALQLQLLGLYRLSGWAAL
ncbi:hypothetical protein BCR34DRAFT_670108 [Clohesyomyces aquaticus]|uniref:Uncharacterized protein n=1 Tax=Clohesyomyces aquaticus TaxID=1231657 RepID=A0A1Y1Y0P4_9PLEO|nr:hypothetical protein BCR34DRAFT_670108 [Clohesyomyces aquaticus]